MLLLKGQLQQSQVKQCISPVLQRSPLRQGRPLRAGDLLPLSSIGGGVKTGNACPAAWVPAYPAEGAPWEIGVLPGPNAAPDYFTEHDISTLYSATYTVHYNS